MPAERSRGSRRTDADGTQLVWTEPALAPGIAFATNLTPGAFEDSKQQSTPDLTFAPPTIVPPADTKLALPPTPTPTSFFFDAPAPDETKPKRASHKRKPTPPPAPSSPSSADSPSSDTADGTAPAPAPHIPRPPNAFILFRSSFIRARAVPAHIEPSHAALSAIAGLTWAALPAPEKERWHSKAKEERERHRERFPGYAFRPRGRAKGSTSTTSTPPVKDTGTSAATDDEGGGGGEEKESKGKPTPPRRRQQRECPPLDRVRQAHIASLILSGLSGAQLQEATAQFDRERRARGEGGMEVRWGGVETPEGRVAAGEKKILEQETAATEKTESTPSVAVRRRTTSKAEKRRPSAPAKRPRVMSSPTFPSSSSVPTTPTDAEAVTSPFAFAFDAMSLPTTPINTTTFEWPYASSPSPSPSSPSSPFDFESYPSSPCTPFDSYPPSPALSHSSSVSHSSVSPSTWGSLEDLSLSLDLPGPSPLSACSSMSSIGGDLSSLNALNSLNADCAMMPVDFSMSMSMYETTGCELMSPFELNLDFGLGLGMDAGVYLTDYMEGTQTQAQGVAW